ncbi:acetyltransferase [Bacillus coahuilensis p1.1.43]|uniref:Acetyltransferase n=1 Tax=Bacillus coahuilensis p1.1.43 TaxID=1150625 RepID=A0A147K6V5_9BACI|nr:GNAT family N-acetyltransferase [Bacillus coahuilensis]KUP05769.1 acetyltransferase [Bacillus coahuilensis p1.1.43]
MKTTKEQVKIVEYHEGLAGQVATMWNESRDNWGGDSIVMTEEDVKNKEENSTNLNLFLATLGDRVVGYCSLSEYREDSGSLYIPLLNVHPDYHGHKIGKRLVLKAVERTIELGWPRLDLFTWAGNTKAVPLYKKCGFFWEDRDDAVHLMNFIPAVMQLEMVQPFFEKHDWYTTSQREIEVKPDGEKQNNFSLYEYEWRADGEYVRIQFERTGRGIRLIETENMLIEMSIPDFKLLEAVEHGVTYRVVNKTNSPISIQLIGKTSETVLHSMDEKVEVTEEWEGTFPVEVKRGMSDPSPWKTHPVAEATMMINGQLLPLKIGVFPKQAAKLQLKTVKKHWRAGQSGKLFLDIESQLDESAKLKVNLPENSVVEWKDSYFETNVEGNGRVSIPIECQLRSQGFLAEQVEVEMETENGASLLFTTRLSIAFPGFGAKFGGETEEYWYGYNGPYYVKIEKRNHIIELGETSGSFVPINMWTPKFGKPFSEEFSKKEALSIEHIELPEAFVLKTTLVSDVFPGITLNVYTKLYGHGLVEMKHEVINKGEAVLDELSLLQPFHTDLKLISMPLNGEVMTSQELLTPYVDYLNVKDMSENWLFSKSSGGEAKAIAWPKEAVGRKDEWRFGIEYKIKDLQFDEQVCLGPIQIGLNTAANWREWREFILGDEAPILSETSMVSFKPKNKNFVSSMGECVPYTFGTLLTSYVHGKLTVQTGEETFVKQIDKSHGLHEMTVDVNQFKSGVNWIEGTLVSNGQRGSFSSLQLVQSHDEVTSVESESGLTIENGAVSFSASAEYYPTVYSMKYNGKEFFHHVFPTPGPKAWWNPWGGGLRYTIHGVSPYSEVKETTTVRTVVKQDQFGNKWTGLCISTEYAQNEKMKGIVLNQYTLTLPGVPVVISYPEIVSGDGRTFINERIDLELFVKPGEELTSSYVDLPTEGIVSRYYAGVEENSLSDTEFAVFGTEEFSEKLTVIQPEAIKVSEVYITNEINVIANIVDWSAAPNQVVQLNPTILLFGEEDRDVKRIRHIFKGLQFRSLT